MSSGEHVLSTATASSLRSQLAHHCSELVNLTAAELIECRWNTRKLVFSSLLSNCPVFTSSCEEIERLTLERESKVRSISSDDRSLRMEVERSFRKNFMEVVLKCLVELGWPPAIEAFANPLPSLCGDNATIVDAIGFLLQFGVMPHSSNRTRRVVQSPTRNSNDHSTASILTQQRPGSSRSKDQVQRILSAGPSIPQYSPPRSSTSQDASESVGLVKSAMLLSSKPLQASSFDDSVESFPTSRLCACGSSCAINKAFEILQCQNESLSKQLKLIQDAVVSRDTAEEKISVVLKDLLGAVKELAEVTSTNSIDAKDIDFSGGERSKKAEPDTKVSKSFRDNFGSKPKPVIPSTSQAIWKSLHGKISELSKSWGDTRREARKAAILSSDLHPACSRLFGKSSATTDVLIFDGPNRILTHKVFGISPSSSIIDRYKGDSWTAGSSVGSLGLDLNRLHHLQRDLLEFSTNASVLIENISIKEVSEQRIYLQNIRELQNLKQTAMQLNLHLAALAPLSPLPDAEEPLSSSLNGLEQLIIEFHRISNKKVPLKIQRLLERSQSEFKTLVLCYKKALNMLSEWSAASSRLVDGASSHKKAPLLGKMGQEMQKLVDYIDNLISDYDKAEAARILPPDGAVKSLKASKKSTKISPMEMLSRGYLGEEVGALMNALRIHLDEIKYAAEVARKIKYEIGKIESEDERFAESQHSTFKLARELTQTFTEKFSIQALQEMSTDSTTTTPRTYASPPAKGKNVCSVKTRPPSTF